MEKENNKNKHLVLLQQLEQIFVGGEVHHGALAVVLHHLGGAAIGSDQHPRHLIALHRLHEIAVAKRARRVGRIARCVC